MTPAQEDHSTPNTRKKDGTFYGIQALRAIAALMVVVEHCIYLWLARVVHTPDAYFWMNGVTGVDIFFVISGFVMAISLPGLAKYQNPVRVFLRRRLTRIVPLYWLATILKIILLVALPGLALHQGLTFTNILGSFLFIPVRNADNIILPVIVVGWTLNFEMFFYMTFSLAMLLKNRILDVLVPLLVSLAVIGMFYRPSWAPITTFASPLLLEFLFGVFIARIAMARRLPGLTVSGILVVTGFLAILTLFPHLPVDTQLVKLRFLIWGIPALMIVLGVAGLEKIWGEAIPKWLISLGDASYAIYLAQTFVLPFVGVMITKLGLVGAPALAVSIGAGLVLSALAGEVVHRFVELPILVFMKTRQQRELGIIG